MGELIQDVRPPNKPESIPPELLRRINRTTDVNYIEHVEADLLIAELYYRGVTIEQVFAQYYAFEEMGNARSMTVGDAELAGATPPVVPNPKPF